MSNFLWYPLAGLLCSRHLQPIKHNINIKLFPKKKKKNRTTGRSMDPFSSKSLQKKDPGIFQTFQFRQIFDDQKKYNHVTFSFGAPSSLLAPPSGHQLKNIDKVWNEENLSRGLTSSLTLWPSLE